MNKPLFARPTDGAEKYIESLEAQVTTLTAELDGLKSELEFMTPAKFAARHARAETLRAETLTAALRRYGQHDAGCPTIADDESDEVLYDYQRCGCGLSAVLRAASEGDK